MRDKDLDQLLLRLHRRARDVSMFLSPLPEETDNIFYRKDRHCQHLRLSPLERWLPVLIVCMALTPFAMFTPVTKMVQVSVCWRVVSHVVVSNVEGKRDFVRTSVFARKIFGVRATPHTGNTNEKSSARHLHHPWSSTHGPWRSQKVNADPCNVHSNSTFVSRVHKNGPTWLTP